MKKKNPASHVPVKKNPAATGEQKKISCIVFQRGENVAVRKKIPASVLYQTRKFLHAMGHEKKVPAHNPPPPLPQRSNGWSLILIQCQNWAHLWTVLYVIMTHFSSPSMYIYLQGYSVTVNNIIDS